MWGPNSIVLIPQFLLELGRKSSEGVLVGWALVHQGLSFTSQIIESRYNFGTDVH